MLWRILVLEWKGVLTNRRLLESLLWSPIHSAKKLISIFHTLRGFEIKGGRQASSSQMAARNHEAEVLWMLDDSYKCNMDAAIICRNSQEDNVTMEHFITSNGHVSLGRRCWELTEGDVSLRTKSLSTRFGSGKFFDCLEIALDKFSTCYNLSLMSC